jgi:hypothetical protein
MGIGTEPEGDGAAARFDEAWGRFLGGDGGEPSLADYLPPTEDPGYLDTLVILVHMDQEVRWSTCGRLPDGIAPRAVEEYVAAFPPLLRHAIIQDLLDHEWKLRKGGEREPTYREFQSRYLTLFGVTERIPGGVPPPSSLSPKDQVVPGYELLRVIGEGGFGVVFEA